MGTLAGIIACLPAFHGQDRDRERLRRPPLFERAGAREASTFQHHGRRRGRRATVSTRRNVSRRLAEVDSPAPAPWAELAGKTLIWTVPSTLIRHLDDPESLLKLWDEVVTAQDEAVALRKRERPERIVLDRQISAGYMHSGYPIMAPIDDSAKLALNEKRLRTEGSWGHFHELGHNHQDGAGRSKAPAKSRTTCWCSMSSTRF